MADQPVDQYRPTSWQGWTVHTTHAHPPCLPHRSGYSPRQSVMCSGYSVCLAEWLAFNLCCRY